MFHFRTILPFHTAYVLHVLAQFRPCITVQAPTNTASNAGPRQLDRQESKSHVSDEQPYTSMIGRHGSGTDAWVTRCLPQRSHQSDADHIRYDIQLLLTLANLTLYASCMS